MKLKLRGFTLIEISIFLAVTGMLFVGIIVGTNNSIKQQRYTDSVQNFAEFLRSVYSDVSNPQGQTKSEGNNNRGRSDKAIYGKLIVFGESTNAAGEENTNNTIFVYDVFGNANGNLGSGDLSQALYDISANIYIKDGNTYTTAGTVRTYLPKWAAKIEPTDNSEWIKTAVLIVRHPRSGTISTLVKKKGNFAANSILTKLNNGDTSQLTAFTEYFKSNGFVTSDIDFCVDPNDNYNLRQDVRISKDARNAAGVLIIGLDSNDNRCRN